MDVEENEYYVLRGAEETIKASNYPKILFECNNREKNKPLFDYLVRLGYSIVELSGVTNMFLATK
jgi:hypothetical protein